MVCGKGCRALVGRDLRLIFLDPSVHSGETVVEEFRWTKKVAGLVILLICDRLLCVSLLVALVKPFFVLPLPFERRWGVVFRDDLIF